MDKDILIELKVINKQLNWIRNCHSGIISLNLDKYYKQARKELDLYED